MHFLFKQRGTGFENENCVGLKLAKTLALHLAPHCAGCIIGSYAWTYGINSINFYLCIGKKNKIQIEFSKLNIVKALVLEK